MEKFYTVTNPKFLKEVKDYYTNMDTQKLTVKEFFKEHSIAGTEFHVHGNGSINVPFDECNKNDIRLYILDCDENNTKFGKELLKPVRLFYDSDVKMRPFRANSRTLKVFQNLCVERKIVINIHPVSAGNYFKELRFGGYTVSVFEYKDICYLQIITDKYNTLTPEYDGFDEIKGSTYYMALEQLEA